MIDHNTAAQNTPNPPAAVRSTSTASRSILPRRYLLGGLLACVLASGCSMLGLSSQSAVQEENARRAAAAKAKKHRKEKSWFDSWFGPEDPPKTTQEWMRRTEPVRVKDGSNEESK